MSNAVESALATVLTDGEKIADNLIPPGSEVEKVLGVLVLQVEKALGGKITALTDEELGLKSEPEQSVDTAATPAEKIAAIKARADREIEEAEKA